MVGEVEKAQEVLGAMDQRGRIRLEDEAKDLPKCWKLRKNLPSLQVRFGLWRKTRHLFSGSENVWFLLGPTWEQLHAAKDSFKTEKKWKNEFSSQKNGHLLLQLFSIWRHSHLTLPVLSVKAMPGAELLRWRRKPGSELGTGLECLCYRQEDQRCKRQNFHCLSGPVLCLGKRVIFWTFTREKASYWAALNCL